MSEEGGLKNFFVRIQRRGGAGGPYSDVFIIVITTTTTTTTRSCHSFNLWAFWQVGSKVGGYCWRRSMICFYFGFFLNYYSSGRRAKRDLDEGISDVRTKRIRWRLERFNSDGDAGGLGLVDPVCAGILLGTTLDRGFFFFRRTNFEFRAAASMHHVLLLSYVCEVRELGE